MSAWSPEQVEPLGDRVFVEMILEEEIRGGIIVPQNAQGHPEKARVLAVGPGALNEKTGERIPLPVQVGDEVLIARFGGTPVGGLDHDNYVIFREQDLLAKVTADVTADV